MLHNVLMLQRRFPAHSGRIVVTLSLLSLSALALGIGMLLLT
ncbi:MAG TPA: hypothetical protein VN493_09245 [Thermoanaerobaculia bacterium]|nr:hypothetical protein [Thermoanaerobaculia bacterium]